MARKPSRIIVVERKLLKSKAYRSLSGMAKNVYNDFLMKRQTETVKRSGREPALIILNNGKIEYTYSEAEKAGIPRSTFMDCIDQLIAKGFLDIAHSGSGGVKGDKSLYFIGERWKSYGMVGFTVVSRPKDTRGGRGFAVYWKKKNADTGIVNRNPPITKNRNRKVIAISMDYGKP